MQKAGVTFIKFHLTLVEHNDPYSNNILIVPGNLERVIWVDFDVTIVYPNDTCIEKKRHDQIVFETEAMESFGWLLVCLFRQLIGSFSWFDID